MAASLLLAASGGTPASASTAADSREVDGVVDASDVPDPRLPEPLASVPLRSRSLALSVDEWRSTKRRLELAQSYLSSIETLLDRAVRFRKDLEIQIAAWRDRVEAAERRVATAESAVELVSVYAYLSHASGGARLEDPTDTSSRLRDRTAFTYTDALARRRVRELQLAREELERSHLGLASTRQAISAAETTLLDLRAARRRAADAVFLLSLHLHELERLIEAQRRLAWVAGGDMQLVALEAYWNASARASSAYPSCHLHWSVLAAIGRVESRHGHWRGSAPDENGLVRPPVRGPRLDGNGRAEVRDSERGVLDGDPVFDRAVGPMQFIPTSWRIYGADGDRDGRAEPDDLHDSALAAAFLLCRSASRLDRPENLHTALLAYNNSENYAKAVGLIASSYRWLDSLLGLTRSVTPARPSG